mmetsp:Transcript_17270/g.67194  ORF Transcript_17270/g.67194 Transcript_17270/m.67194 type:complete len:228 (-) Transcript_17270:974-1657(-)
MCDSSNDLLDFEIPEQDVERFSKLREGERLAAALKHSALLRSSHKRFSGSHGRLCVQSRIPHRIHEQIPQVCSAGALLELHCSASPPLRCLGRVLLVGLDEQRQRCRPGLLHGHTRNSHVQMQFLHVVLCQALQALRKAGREFGNLLPSVKLLANQHCIVAVLIVGVVLDVGDGLERSACDFCNAAGSDGGVAKHSQVVRHLLVHGAGLPGTRGRRPDVLRQAGAQL